MKLERYLRQFKNIAWYPSAYKDFKTMACLSPKFLMDLGMPKEETPDCFIFTDYCSYADYEDNHRFFLDLEDYESEVTLSNHDGYKATFFNIKELERVRIGFDSNMTAFGNDRYYGKVYIADVLVEHPTLGKNVAKLVYFICENTKFAFDFLLKKNIKITYAIHNCYGHGFGGGISNGSYMLQVLKDLGVKHLISDMGKNYVGDDADVYLSEEQKNAFPILRERFNYSSHELWWGYDNTYLYDVVGFKQREIDSFRRGRFYYSYEVEYPPNF